MFQDSRALESPGKEQAERRPSEPSTDHQLRVSGQYPGLAAGVCWVPSNIRPICTSFTLNDGLDSVTKIIITSLFLMEIRCLALSRALCAQKLTALSTLPPLSLFFLFKLNRCLQFNVRKHFTLVQSRSGGLTVYRRFQKKRTLEGFRRG